jgi:hypothetical protein
VDRHTADVVIGQNHLATVNADPDGDADRRQGIDQCKSTTDPGLSSAQAQLELTRGIGSRRILSRRLSGGVT